MDEFGSDDDGTRAAHRERVDARDSMFLQARMRTSPDQDGTPMRVRNLSAGGLMADCTLAVSQGQEVEIELRNVGIVPGEIIWVRGQQIGVAFFHRIDPHAARKPVGTHASETMLVKRPSQRARRPGLRSE